MWEYTSLHKIRAEDLMRTLAAFMVTLAWTTLASAQATYTPPAASSQAVAGIDFASGIPLTSLQSRYSTCDQTDMCDGKPVRKNYSCKTDPSRNTAILKLKNNVIFFDGKMAIDADGSQLSKSRGGTDLPETAWRYPTSGASVDAEHVPYLVLSKEFVKASYANLRPGVTIRTGDIAAIIYKDKTAYALVADTGPACKIGEGSMKLHDELGHPSCARKDGNGICIKAINSGLPSNVLYFVFPDSAKTISKGLAPENVNERLSQEGPKLLQTLQGK